MVIPENNRNNECKTSGYIRVMKKGSNVLENNVKNILMVLNRFFFMNKIEKKLNP